MRLTSLAAAVTGAIAAAALTPGLTGRLGAHAAAAQQRALGRWRGRSEDGCGDAGPFPLAALTFTVDGCHTGPCIAALREKYLDEDGAVGVAVSTFSYEEALLSMTEVALVMASNIGAVLVSDEEGCFGAEEFALATARVLTDAAHAYEEVDAEAKRSCRNCRRLADASPNNQRARFCRDLADDFLLNMDSESITVHGLSLQAAFDVVCLFVETVAEDFDTPVEAQVERISAGLVDAIAHSDAA